MSKKTIEDKAQESEIINEIEFIRVRDLEKHSERLRFFLFESAPIMIVTIILMLGFPFGVINYMPEFEPFRGDINAILLCVGGAILWSALLYLYPRRMSYAEMREGAEFEVWRREQ